MLKKYIKCIALIVCLCFTVCSLSNTALASSTKKTDKYNLNVVNNDDSKCTVVGEYEGDKFYATLNKDTGEITMNSVEQSKTLLGTQTKKDYRVKVEKFEDDELIASIVDKETSKEFKINQNSSTVTAQFAIALPLLEVLGAALLRYLLQIAASVVIAGATYIAASACIDYLRNKPYDYYMAYRSSSTNKVYIGPSITATQATSRVTNGLSIFCKTTYLAAAIAYDVGCGFYRGPEIHGSGPDYFWHWHPQRPSGGSCNSAHCWYF